MENQQRNALILGALLHDIGKFWQRAEKVGGIDNAQFLDSDVRNTVSSDICPNRTWNNRTNLTHQHAAWTYQFLANYENALYHTGTTAEESVLHLAANHHRQLPSTTLQTIIQVADCISAGQDRNGDIEDIKDEIDRSYNYRKQRQRPVFESIFKQDFIDSHRHSSEINRYEFRPLALDKNIIPRDLGKEDRELCAEYQRLWDEFSREFVKIPNKNFHAYVETLLSLLFKYTWCIPSSTNDSPDISLYDHLRSTTAIATCLYDYLGEKNPSLIQPGEKTQQEKIKAFYDNDEKFALLIAADISGIQKFIYQISSVKAATSLKGRSFYLQIICDAAARCFLQRLNLPSTNLIYSSGGNFFLLAPNTQSVKDKITEITREINKNLLMKYNGNLFLGVGQTKLSGKDFLYNLSDKWGEAIRNANAAKRRRFSNFADEAFFKPQERKNAEACDNCGADCDTSDLTKIKGDEEEKYCPLCREFIRAGNKLKDAQFLIEFADSKDKIKESFYPLGDIPIGYIMSNADNLSKNVETSYGSHFKKIYHLNNTDYLIERKTALLEDFAYGFKFYGGNYLPRNQDNEPATFDYLAGVRDNPEEETTSFKRLGVLRMDVDNLGAIFSRGFLYDRFEGEKIQDRKEPYSIARISTLSSMLDIFFSGYLNTLHQKEDKDYKDLLYILYSGGDDLFIVGRWDKVIDFAALIRDEFKKFTCQHPDLSISGGLALTPPKYPIHRSADLAGEAEEISKSKRIINGQEMEKDAFCFFFGKILCWNDFKVARALKEALVQWINNNQKPKMNRGLINRLNQIYAVYQKEAYFIHAQNKKQQCKMNDVDERIKYNKWRWRLVYSLSRFKEQNKDYEDEIKSIQNALIDCNSFQGLQSEQPIIEYLDIPVRWTEFTLRTNKKEDVL